jgi:hypothetical protein
MGIDAKDRKERKTNKERAEASLLGAHSSGERHVFVESLFLRSFVFFRGDLFCFFG